MQPGVKTALPRYCVVIFIKIICEKHKLDVLFHRNSGWLSCLVCVSVHKQLHEGALIAPRNGILHGLEF